MNRSEPIPAVLQPPGGWPFALRVAAVMAVLVLVCGVTVTVIGQRSARQEARRMADDLFEEVARHAVDRTRAYVNQVTPVLTSLQGRAHRSLLPLDDNAQLLEHLLVELRANDDVSWISYADPSGRFVGVTRNVDGTLGTNVSYIADGKTNLTESVVQPDGSLRVSNVNPDSGYDPRKRSFYTAAAAAGGRMVWLDPYIFYGQNVPGVTCAAAVMGGREVRGVLTIDFALTALNRHFATLRASEHSRLFLTTAGGKLIAQQSATPIVAATTLPTLRDVDPRLAEFADRTARGERRFGYDVDGRPMYASATAFDVGPEQRWVVGVMAPASDFLGAAQRSQRMALIACAVALAIAVALAALLSRRVSSPVAELRSLMVRIGGGDLDAQADVRGAREFRELSTSLNRMVKELRDGIRLRHSIGVAMEVQKRLLPEHPPAVDGLDIAGYSRYCDETGGDYYDFLITDPDAPGQVAIVVGDVMGHGVGSALMMASVRAVLRDRAIGHVDLAELLSRLNQIVSRDAGGAQFMTMMLAVIDAPHEEYRFASAGHDPAIIYRVEDRKCLEIDEAGLPLGVMDDTQYAEARAPRMVKGDTILIGTDGVWETHNVAGEMFGKERIRELLQRCAALPAEDIVKALLLEVDTFRGDCPMADDVTFVVVKFGSPVASRI